MERNVLALFHHSRARPRGWNYLGIEGSARVADAQEYRGKTMSLHSHKIAYALAAALCLSAHAAETKAPKEASKASAEKERKMLMGYYPNWSHYNGFTAEKIQWDYLTHLLYAFYIPDN